MTEVDTSIYKSAQTPNMLTGIGQAISAANGLQQNQLLQTANDQNKLDLTLKQVGAFRQSLGSLLNKPDLSNADIRDAATNAVAQGFATPQQVATELSGLPSDDAPMSQRQAWVTNHYMRQVSHETQLQQLVGGIGTVNNGAGTQFVQTAPSRGVSTPQGVSNIPTQQTPGQKTETVTVMRQGQDGRWQPYAVPKGQMFDQYGNLRGPDAPQPQQIPNVPAAASSGQPQPTYPQARPPQPTQQQQSTIGIPTAAPLGTETATNEVAQSSGKMMASDLEASRNFRSAVNPLEQAIPALERLGPEGTGPTSETTNQIKSTLQTLGMIGPNQNVKDYDEAQKYLTDWVNKNGNTGTNDKLAAAIAGNPSTKISNAAAVDVAKTALALRRMQEAQTKSNLNVPPDQYATATAKWQGNQDPRAYAFDLMSPHAQQSLLKSLGPASTPGKPNAAYDKFIGSLKAAHESQVLSQPQGQ